MRAFCRWRWCALALVLALSAPAARAEMITPNSIPNPPSAVDSAGGTLVYANNLVSNQYTSLGLNFKNDVAITKWYGSSIWTPLGDAANASGSINYSAGLSGGFVSPGSQSPTTVSSLSVDVVGQTAVSIHVYGINGQLLNITPQIGSVTNIQDWMFTGPGMSSFAISPSNSQTGAWGVSAVSFTPSTAATPEPSSLVLAALGALGMASRLGWRRLRAVVA